MRPGRLIQVSPLWKMIVSPKRFASSMIGLTSVGSFAWNPSQSGWNLMPLMPCSTSGATLPAAVS